MVRLKNVYTKSCNSLKKWPTSGHIWVNIGVVLSSAAYYIVNTGGMQIDTTHTKAFRGGFLGTHRSSQSFLGDPKAMLSSLLLHPMYQSYGAV